MRARAQLLHPARAEGPVPGGRAWHTWIDYEKFQELVASGEPFTSDQYMLPTPRWSVWGAEEGGFDPGETRVRKVRNHPGKEKKEEGAA